MIALAAVLSIAVSTAARLDVPYLAQTPSLCGGAAAAMVFRYWGDRHATPEPFSALVDQAAGGIATNRLVAAIRDRRWQATPFTGTVDVLRNQLASGHPIILLLEDRPGTFHYVVAVGDDESGVFVHDPAWGPSRHLSGAALDREWQASDFWALLVLPTDAVQHGDESTRAATTAAAAAAAPATTCDRLLASAVADISRNGLDTADDALGSVRTVCPADAAPVAELAGVRFAEHRWLEAARLAEDASSRDPSNAYSWDVLGSSRFMLDDVPGALTAWNRIGKPKVDSVAISGLTRTRYQLVAETLSLPPGTLLTAERLRLAERRLGQLPDHSRARVSVVPEADGYAIVDVAIAEASTVPRTLGGFAALGVNAAINREIAAAIPGTEGQGEIWSASWRWWENRPMVALSFAAPRLGFLPGAWRVRASWEAQSFAPAQNAPILREDRINANVMVSNWLSHAWRYELYAGADSWEHSRRAASLGGTIERRGLQDRAVASATLEHWVPFSGSPAFSRALLVGSFRSSADAEGVVNSVDAGVEGVTSFAPLSLWPGAGDGHARAPLLRAHPLLVDGIVTGPVFGRRVAFASDDVTYWLDRPALAHVGIAVFADTAGASGRMANAEGLPFQFDTGAGLRVRLAGGTLRVDYAHGLRDGQNAVTAGFTWVH